MNTKVDNAELAGVLLDGARRLCDHASDQWLSGKYGGDEEMRRDNLQRWAEIRRNLPSKKELVALLNTRAGGA